MKIIYYIDDRWFCSLSNVYKKKKARFRNSVAKAECSLIAYLACCWLGRLTDSLIGGRCFIYYNKKTAVHRRSEYSCADAYIHRINPVFVFITLYSVFMCEIYIYICFNCPFFQTLRVSHVSQISTPRTEMTVTGRRFDACRVVNTVQEIFLFVRYRSVENL